MASEEQTEGGPREGHGSPTVQQSLVGEEAERVECEYYDGCRSPALFIDEILHYGEGEKPVKMCESCADEHMEVEGNTVQRLKPEDRYVGEEAEAETVWVVAANYADDPHPDVEGVYESKEDAEEMMEKCRKVSEQPNPVAWDLTEREVLHQ